MLSSLFEIVKIISESKIDKTGSLPKDKRDVILGNIKGMEGASQRRAARIIGISPNIMFKTRFFGSTRTVHVLPSHWCNSKLNARIDVTKNCTQ